MYQSCLNTFEQKDYLDLNSYTKTHDLQVLVNTDTWLLDVYVYKSHVCLCIYRPTHELCILGEDLNGESFDVLTLNCKIAVNCLNL